MSLDKLIILTMPNGSPHWERALSALQEDLAATQLAVRRVTGKAIDLPPGSKGLSQDISLVVTASVPALSVLATVLRSWIRSHERHTIKIVIGKDSIELAGPWSDAQEKALDAFLTDHAS